MDASSKLVRSHIIDQLSRAYGDPKEVDESPLISVKSYSRSLTTNDETCLAECPITPFISRFRHNVTKKYESEVAHLLWGAVATITHFSGAVLGAYPLCTQKRNGLFDRMQIIGITHFQLQVVHWVTRTLFIIVQNVVILIGAILFLGGEFTAYSFFSGWCVIVLQTLCGFSFGILLYGLLRKTLRIILVLVVVEFIVSSLSGNIKLAVFF